jgi:hypothetical protein
MTDVNISTELPIEGTLNDGPEETVEEEVKEAVTEEVAEEVKETPAELPAEPEKEEKPAESVKTEVSDDTGLEKQLRGLQDERVKLLKEIQELRGQRRELKHEELIKVDNKIDQLKDVNPDDVQVIEKVLRAKGYVTKDEAEKMTYQAVQQEELNKFLAEFPEYKPENDPHDLNWSSLQRALAIYAKPSDPRKWSEILKKAHKDMAPAPSDRTLEVQKQQLKTAGIGTGGVQKSSSRKTLTPDQRQVYKDGGWSEEEIKQIEQNL